MNTHLLSRNINCNSVNIGWNDTLHQISANVQPQTLQTIANQQIRPTCPTFRVLSQSLVHRQISILLKKPSSQYQTDSKQVGQVGQVGRGLSENSTKHVFWLFLAITISA